MACSENKAQKSECGECKTECCGDKKECDKEKCEKKCDKQNCDKQQCEKNCEKQDCNKQQCEKKCEKSECSEKVQCAELPAGCIPLNTEGFANLIADLSKEWKYLGDKPAVVDFYADWCGPCKAISPILEEIAKEYAGQLYIYKVNVDNDPAIADAFNIQAIPTLLFIPMEGRYSVKTGGMGKEELVNIIKEKCFKQ
jgi:thioredoxin